MSLPVSPQPCVFSVDVEDYFHVEAFADVVKRSDWETCTSRVVANTHRILELLEAQGVTATFFVLGWVAEREPELVRDIAKGGHEVGCHSYWHRPIFHLSVDDFREDTRRAKDTIEQLIGTPVRGYRAPSFSITRKSLWAFEVLGELGFTYDSSIFPILHDVYGMPDGPRRPTTIRTAFGELAEFPMTTFSLAGARNFPVGGGGYLRILPFWYTRWGLRAAAKDNVPFILYVHPWEFDPEQPRLQGRLRSRLRHYTNLDKMEQRIRRLLREFSFTSFRDSALPDSLETHSMLNLLLPTRAS
jgi:polysaccharide deacetylase family protein (PEP-CTERM system associated)